MLAGIRSPLLLQNIARCILPDRANATLAALTPTHELLVVALLLVGSKHALAKVITQLQVEQPIAPLAVALDEATEPLQALFRTQIVSADQGTQGALAQRGAGGQ